MANDMLYGVFFCQFCLICFGFASVACVIVAVVIVIAFIVACICWTFNRQLDQLNLVKRTEQCTDGGMNRLTMHEIRSRWNRIQAGQRDIHLWRHRTSTA